jgi:membrane-associated phospholipid phosphatase
MRHPRWTESPPSSACAGRRRRWLAVAAAVFSTAAAPLAAGPRDSVLSARACSWHLSSLDASSHIRGEGVNPFLEGSIDQPRPCTAFLADARPDTPAFAATGVLLAAGVSRMTGGWLATPAAFPSMTAAPLAAEPPDGSPASPIRPRYRWSVDAPLAGAAGGLLIVASRLSVSHQVVPPQGLDPATIHWAIDRRVVGKVSERADSDSDYFLVGSLAYPMVLAFASQPSGARLGGTLHRTLEYAEAYALAEGVNTILKSSIDRPRPYTYLPVGARPDNPAYDVTTDVAFSSMPSGHAVQAFTGAAFGVTDHLLTRPAASWQERVAISAVGGFLAGATATLRVEGGQHFPTDTFVGGLIGTASGVTVPLLHHYATPDGRRAPRPSGRAWWQAIGGFVGGMALGYVTGAALY